MENKRPLQSLVLAIMSALAFMATSQAKPKQVAITAEADQEAWPDDGGVWERTIELHYVPQRVLIDHKNARIQLVAVTVATNAEKESADVVDPPVEIVGAVRGGEIEGSHHQGIEISECVVQEPCTVKVLVRTKPYATSPSRRLIASGWFEMPFSSADDFDAEATATFGPWVESDEATSLQRLPVSETGPDAELKVRELLPNETPPPVRIMRQTIDVAYVGPGAVPVTKKDRSIRSADLDLTIAMRRTGTASANGLVELIVSSLSTELLHETFTASGEAHVTAHLGADAFFGSGPCKLADECTASLRVEARSADARAFDGFFVRPSVNGSIEIEAEVGPSGPVIPAHAEVTFGSWQEAWQP